MVGLRERRSRSPFSYTPKKWSGFPDMETHDPSRQSPHPIRPYTDHDRRDYQRMRLALWPDCDDADIDPWIARPDATTLLATRSDGALCGFVEVGARSHAEQCETSPVGFIEGWYVDPDARARG